MTASPSVAQLYVTSTAPLAPPKKRNITPSCRKHRSRSRLLAYLSDLCNESDANLVSKAGGGGKDWGADEEAPPWPSKYPGSDDWGGIGQPPLAVH
ncbi:hypothetical protein PG991_003859 [Apiospora marii]|uniref:Uncharacterized protein n=1 Tax=Apiospora marii TaxID=335849 RepID=A0ABR1S609_9PEZI